MGDRQPRELEPPQGEAPEPQITCPCGCSFPAALGKYGCPNCEGDEATRRPRRRR